MRRRRFCIAAVVFVVASPLAVWPAVRAANAGPQELSEYVHRLLEDDDLPETADDAVIEIIDNGKKTELTGRQLKAAYLQQVRLTTGHKLKEFNVENVECRAESCTIRYDFRAWTKFGGREVSQSIQSEEEYRVTSSGFMLIRAHQVQHTENEL